MAGVTVRPTLEGVDQPVEPLASSTLDAPVDLTRLERIEGELQAVERALEQIDQGVYEGFAGLDSLASPTAPPQAPDPEVFIPEG